MGMRDRERTRTYLVAHSEPSVVDCWTPEIGDKGDVEEIDNVKPSIQDEPSGFPVVGDEIGVTSGGKGKGVEEEKAKDYHYTAKDTPPELLIHERFDTLFSFEQILHCEI